MKAKFLVVALMSTGLVSSFAQAQESVTSEINASLRLGLGLTTDPDPELTFNDYASRIGWKGTADAGDGLKAISRVEFGYDQDNGVSTTRYAFLGVEGDFGTVTGGKQYAAFYDAVSAAVDIAYWDSCLTEISCSRQSSVVKFAGKENGNLQLLASTTLIEGDAGNDFIDGIDLAAISQSGDMKIGAGLSIDFGDSGIVVDQFGNEFIVDQDAGFAAGVSVTLPLDDATVSGTLQFANDDFVGGTDNGFIVTAAYKKDEYYGIVSVADADNTPYFITLGYEKPVIEDRAFAYFELGISDEDTFGSDIDLQARAVMVYNLDILSTGQ